jgi:PAS domain S-box-containing protein
MPANEIDAWLAAIVDASHDAIVTMTLDGTIGSWNRGADRLFGYAAAEVVGRQLFVIVPPDRVAEEHDLLARWRRGERIDDFETIRQTKDGVRVPISLTVSPVRDECGNLIGASMIARDIRMRLQRDEVRARLAEIVRSSDDAIVGKTLDGVITSWNQGAERLFGYTAVEAVGQPIFLIIPEDRRAEEEDVLSRLRRGERIQHFETIRRTKDGRRVPISLSVSPIRDDQGRIIGAAKVARDISDRVERERMQLLTRLVIAQEDERAEVARELHDELGQQMTALRLTLETLKAATVDRHDLSSQIEMLQEMARQLDADVAFHVRGLRPALLETHGLAAALREYAGNWSHHFRVPLRLHTNLSGDDRLPPALERTMYRVAQEALNNVLKHARARTVNVEISTIENQVTLAVRDDGQGFDASSARRGRWGMTTMRERVEAAGGSLRLESAPGQGTRVLATVPL